jgi:hypothetical protein
MKRWLLPILLILRGRRLDFCPEDGDSMFLRSVSILLQNYTVSSTIVRISSRFVHPCLRMKRPCNMIPPEWSECNMAALRTRAINIYDYMQTALEGGRSVLSHSRAWSHCHSRGHISSCGGGNSYRFDTVLFHKLVTYSGDLNKLTNRHCFCYL